MTFLTILVIAIGVLIAFLIARAPRRTVQLLEHSENQKTRIEGLADLLAQLCELTECARLILEQAAQRPDAVISYVLGESDPHASRSDRINNSLDEIYRFFAAQRSNEPIAVMERMLATGRSI